jgi:transposase
MAIVGGLDLHRKQVTFDVVDTATGACERGRIAPADRESFQRWLAGFEGQPVDLAVVGCTGWRFVVEECWAADVHAHLAEPVEVAGLKGRRQDAKTDQLDARHLRELLEAGNMRECWIPPRHVLEIRAKVRLYRDLLEERRGWQQYIHATLLHLGAPTQPDLLGPDPDRLARLEALTPATRQTTMVTLRMIDALDASPRCAPSSSPSAVANPVARNCSTSTASALSRRW